MNRAASVFLHVLARHLAHRARKAGGVGYTVYLDRRGVGLLRVGKIERF